ncbi:uncharacterized protein LOC122267006 [Penaeus japonicus]|uniref:uncharacterized protein LOC122267006 n=1 Tax=Penaeus japonicus TaxID=27405 RepID=UPI001C70EA24|nr:uncharacterized protein LOC122267006 [Penaeus japonicus]
MFYTRSNSESGWSADVTFVDAPGYNTATTTPPSSSSCSLVSATEGVSWFSPNFGSENYPNNIQCGLKGSSASPYTSTFALNTFQLQGKKQGKCVDFVGIQIPYNRTVKLCGNRKGSIVVPNMNLNVNFVTDAWKQMLDLI